MKLHMTLTVSPYSNKKSALNICEGIYQIHPCLKTRRQSNNYLYKSKYSKNSYEYLNRETCIQLFESYCVCQWRAQVFAKFVYFQIHFEGGVDNDIPLKPLPYAFFGGGLFSIGDLF